jgi:hypothetical protein
MSRRITLSLLAIFLAISFRSQAQIPSMNPINGVLPAVLNAAGGTYDNASSYYRYEWSLGELVLVQAWAPADSSFLITQGVLQPCTDQIINSPHILIFNQGEYRLFPNPTTGKFELNFFVKIPGRMSLQLINSVGQILETRNYYYNGCCNIELFDISHRPNGVYFVVADLKPDHPRPEDRLEVIRHSGFKVIKISN